MVLCIFNIQCILYFVYYIILYFILNCLIPEAILPYFVKHGNIFHLVVPADWFFTGEHIEWSTYGTSSFLTHVVRVVLKVIVHASKVVEISVFVHVVATTSASTLIRTCTTSLLHWVLRTAAAAGLLFALATLGTHEVVALAAIYGACARALATVEARVGAITIELTATIAHLIFNAGR